MSEMVYPHPLSPRRALLADFLFAKPQAAGFARDATLVLAGALLTAGCAQVSIPLGFTPVPITLQTFAVLLTAAALGPWRGLASMGLYVLLGLVGLPFYKDGGHGWAAATGATGGYLVGFVVSAGVVGWLARRGWDRRPLGTAAMMILGTAVIFACGVPWLWHVLGCSVSDALVKGLWPFLPGAGVKIAAAAGLLPAAWWLVGERRDA